jgi:sulfopyruvate decarboxylase TPP-binding subunit
MKRILVAALPVLAAALLLAGPAAAVQHKVSCKQIDTQLQAGKKAPDIAKNLKVSKRTVKRCEEQMASAKKNTGTSEQAR